MRKILYLGLGILLSGCAALDTVSTAADVVDDVKYGKDVVYTGVVDTCVAQGKSLDLRFQDGVRYTVKGTICYSHGQTVRIRKDGNDYVASTNSLDEGVVASGRLTRIDHRAKTSVLFLENGSSYEVTGDPDVAIGSLIVIEKDKEGYRARRQ